MWLIIALVGGCAVLLLVTAIGSRLAAMLTEVKRQGENVAGDARWRVYPDLLLQEFNSGHSDRIRLAGELDARLEQAARPGQLTGRQYLAFAQLASPAAAIVTLGLGFLGQFGIIGSLIAAVAVGGMTWWIMLSMVGSWVAERQKAVSREFPYFLDLAVLMMGAGANFREVLRTYLRIAGKSQLAIDIKALESEVAMGVSTDSALETFEARIPSPDVVSVIRAIRQGIRMGTPISTTFRDQAEAIRFRRSQRAERDAEELKVKLQGPTMVLMIAILLLVLGPALVSMRDGGR